MKSIIQTIRNYHMLAMILCCVAPFVGIFVLSAFGILENWSYYALLLACPLGHLLIIRTLYSSSPKRSVEEPPRQIEYSPK